MERQKAGTVDNNLSNREYNETFFLLRYFHGPEMSFPKSVTMETLGSTSPANIEISNKGNLAFITVLLLVPELLEEPRWASLHSVGSSNGQCWELFIGFSKIGGG